MKNKVSLILVLIMIISMITAVSFSAAQAPEKTGTQEALLTPYISTNPYGQIGKYKTIAVDGDASDWDSSMLIAQGVANDDPRVYMDSSMHENPVDSYALYAAWDDSNLYLMWEMKNMQDMVAPKADYPLTQAWLFENHDLPYFLAFNTGKHTPGDGTFSNGDTLWQSGITWDAPIDTLYANSMNYWNGPYVYNTNKDGKFEYNQTQHKEIKVLAAKGPGVSEKCYGIDKAYGRYNNRFPGDVTDPAADWIDFYQTNHKKTLDYFYEVSIPFTVLGIDRDYLENTGITVMHIQTFGTSAMNTLPVDLSTYDNANVPYSKESSTSHEKEDEDHITVPLAQIGKFTGDIPIPPDPTVPSESTEESSSDATSDTVDTEEKTEPTGSEYYYGDADLNGKVEVSDATTVQQKLAKLITLSKTAEKVADVDGSGVTDITDATMIQQKLAKLISEFPAGEKYTVTG